VIEKWARDLLAVPLPGSRGTTAFNRGSGDPDHQPNPSLAPIEKPPFYAIKVLPGSFGTFAGLKPDAHARVLGIDGDPIPGLYAAGRDAAGATEYENVVPVALNDGI
jgi:FAD binding domain